MSERVDWSREEVEACVSGYLRMLELELNGQRYNKTEHASSLVLLLNDGSRAFVEFKHANISAVMIALLADSGRWSNDCFQPEAIFGLTAAGSYRVDVRHGRAEAQGFSRAECNTTPLSG